ncbi:MAG: IS630 transposase-related protein [Nitrospira sp.]|nr:IS630 transposase-related protein [Nitrospira sp.]MDF0665059.1 IS630 transposase-related protein [Nitrospira sp.]MDF0665748.1 IS630 transposase-related protein [Nitrospira sp.]MDF0667266.1 IS630 transposase-related protein [Nitrospira sp.]MDF0667430.1 IS630 transposase-related protein [Nitrospira sp.]
MRCSSDLRQRVVDFVRSGGSKAEAARRFKVGEASVYRWLKPGGLAYKRPGPQRPHKLDWDALRRHVEVHPDRTQAERARHFQVSRHCIWNALHKLALTHKKKDRVPGARSAATETIPAPARAVLSPWQTTRPYR